MSMSMLGHRAAAQQPRAGIALEWRAPHGCPDRDAVLQILRARLPERYADVALHARAQVQRRAQGFRLTVELDTPSGRASRSLSDPHCASLAEAAAVLIVLALENEATTVEPATATEAPDMTESIEASSPPPRAERPAEASPNEEPSDEDTPREARPEPSAQEDARSSTTSSTSTSSPRPLHLQLSAAVRGDLGSFPHAPALGAQLQLAARIRPLYTALGITYWPAREVRSDLYPNARLHGSGLFADLSVGADVSGQPLVLTPALTVELGQLDAEALGIAGPQRSRVLWLAAGPSMAATLSLFERWEIALEVSGLFPAYRNHWLVRTPDGDVTAFNAASLVLRLALRVGFVLR
jgi:hypothetical protein